MIYFNLMASRENTFTSVNCKKGYDKAGTRRQVNRTMVLEESTNN